VQKERELFLLTTTSNNSAMKQYYKAYCKVLTNVIREAKRMTLNKRISKSNNKKKTARTIINEMLHKQYYTQGIQKINIEGKYVSTQQNIANAFNTYFSTIIDKINKENQENIKYGNHHTYRYFDQNVEASYPPLAIKPFSTHEILSVIKSIKTKKPSGYDEISTKILKISANYTCSPLTHMCNKSVLTSPFPERLKNSTIKPIYKKGDRVDLSNYRPISWLTSFSSHGESLIQQIN
jgi:hypothetical protein